MDPSETDIAVIGAGAAGLMTAIQAARTAASKGGPLGIVLLDTKPMIGAKILMSGGTRCNVTNRKVLPSDFQGGPRHFVKHVFEAFTPEETREFFKGIGVELVLEPTGKYFPATHSAKTVLDALVREMEHTGVRLETGVRVGSVKKTAGGFRLQTQEGKVVLSAKKIVLATGGLSYPGTGSDGGGYEIARAFGHSLVSTFPALTPILTDDMPLQQLSGITLPVRLSFFINGKKTAETRDSFLFTHFGFSGPAALDLSRHVAASDPGERPEVFACFLPDAREESFKKAFQAAAKASPKKGIRNLLAEDLSLPVRLAEILVEKSGLRDQDPLGHLSADAQKKLARLLFHCPLRVRGVFGYQKAEVTAGGVDLKEVNVATMESRIEKGLYFAGEILDADGRIGGFNFQWAWSTGAVAGRSAARSLIR